MTSADELPASQINKVSVVLPPPGRLGGHSTGSREMSMDLQRAIAKLLRACGLNTSIQGTSRQKCHTHLPSLHPI